MANLVVNQWLQDAVEKACQEHVGKLVRPDAGVASVSFTVTPMYNGLEVDASWDKHGERMFQPFWFTAKEALQIFLGLEPKDDHL